MTKETRSNWIGTLPVICGTLLLTLILVGHGFYSLARADAGAFTCKDRLARISDALVAYEEKHGSVPESLSELVDDGLIEQRDINCPWTESPYVYKRCVHREATEDAVCWDSVPHRPKHFLLGRMMRGRWFVLYRPMAITGESQPPASE